MPFLIIPNQGFEWFSFIYRSYKEIPIEIQNFLVANEEILVRKKNKKVTDDELRKLVFKEHEVGEL